MKILQYLNAFIRYCPQSTAVSWTVLHRVHKNAKLAVSHSSHTTLHIVLRDGSLQEVAYMAPIHIDDKYIHINGCAYHHKSPFIVWR